MVETKKTRAIYVRTVLVFIDTFSFCGIMKKTGRCHNRSAKDAYGI